MGRFESINYHVHYFTALYILTSSASNEYLNTSQVVRIEYLGFTVQFSDSDCKVLRIDCQILRCDLS